LARASTKRSAFASSIPENKFILDGRDERLPRLWRVLQSAAARIHGIPDGDLPVYGRYLHAGSMACATPSLTPLKVAILQIDLGHQISFIAFW
jgi:hypothetical protein